MPLQNFSPTRLSYDSMPSADLQVMSEKIKAFVSQKNYPCIGALRAVKTNDYRIGIYKNFGSAQSCQELYRDLNLFLQEQKTSNSPYLSFWAAFPDQKNFSEDDFESALWSELSALSQLDQKPWDPNFSSDASDKNFCFSLDGQAYFVVGLHQQSSRKSRQFEYPSLVFNLYEKFEMITRLGQYELMVETNRKKSKAYEGDVNPMVEKYGDHWEAIQFSGKQNTENWKCPFHHKTP
jgi:FPC/CPF motif-containing protein YcgG